MTIEFKGRDKHLEKHIIDSGILKAINSLSLANYPNAQNHLADFLKSVGLPPKGIIKHYRSPEDIDEMKKEIDESFEIIKTIITA